MKNEFNWYMITGVYILFFVSRSLHKISSSSILAFSIWKNFYLIPIVKDDITYYSDDMFIICVKWIFKKKSAVLNLWDNENQMDTVFTRLYIIYTYVVIVFIVVFTDLFWDTGYICINIQCLQKSKQYVKCT